MADKPEKPEDIDDKTVIQTTPPEAPPHASAPSDPVPPSDTEETVIATTPPEAPQQTAASTAPVPPPPLPAESEDEGLIGVGDPLLIQN